MESYSVTGRVGYTGFLPDKLDIRDGQIKGTLGTKQADTEGWRVPPHVAFANIRLAPSKMLTGFFRQYGGFEIRASYVENIEDISSRATPTTSPSEMLDLGLAQLVKQDFQIKIADLRSAQIMLQMGWRGDRSTFVFLGQAVTKGQFLLASPVDPDNDLITTRDLWAYTCFLFLADYEDGRARICPFRDCPTPYFVKQRKNQEYCSHRCAVNDNNLRRAESTKIKNRGKR